MPNTDDRGRFVWYDLMANDSKAAEDFYTKLIGWGTQEWGGGEQPYTLWTNKEVPLGGIAELPKEIQESGAPPHWLAYVSVDDTEAVAGRVSEAGGKIMHPPTQIPNEGGSYAVLVDPQGALFAIYSSTKKQEPCGPPQVGQFSWHELATTDSKAAFAFYSQIFGWQKGEAMKMGEEAGIYQIYSHGEVTLGGMFTKPEEMEGPPMWLYYISVDDVSVSVDKVKELGGQVVNGPMEVPGGDLIAQCLDPQGALFALYSSSSD